MSKITKKITIPVKSNEDRINPLNGLFKLTDKEVIILSKFLDKKEELRDVNIDPFSSEAKKQISEELGMEDSNTLNVYIKRLKDKNVIKNINGTYQFNPLVEMQDNEKGVLLKWQDKRRK